MEQDFHQMLFWESENPALWAVHHLMVLCYHLQNPHIYSVEGLQFAKNLLRDFVEDGKTTDQIRQDAKSSLDKRAWKVTARPDSQGVYQNPVTWTMTATDVVAGGQENYVENVEKWARSVYVALQESGNL